ncbi:bZIP transcription factor, partial [Halorubrum pallidum]
MSNRVEDLERQVSELQAAVNGLTEELVEMKERVRQLEDAQTMDAEASETPPEPADSEPQPDEPNPDAD